MSGIGNICEGLCIAIKGGRDGREWEVVVGSESVCELSATIWDREEGTPVEVGCEVYKGFFCINERD